MNSNLRHYPLPSRIVDTLNRADSLAVQFNRLGQPAPNEIDVSAVDLASVDMIVRSVTNGRMTAQNVTWNGRPLSSLAA